MEGLSAELRQRFDEASKDTAWLAKIRAATTTWEEYVKLLSEKGIEAPPEMKEKFNAARTVKTGKLGDDELEEVAGGYLLPCYGHYDMVMCHWSQCPHMYDVEKTPDKDHYTTRCDLHNWAIVYSYPGRHY